MLEFGGDVVGVFGVGSQVLGAKVVVVTDLPAQINAADVIVVVASCARREQCTDGRSLAKAMGIAAYERSVRVLDRLAIGTCRPGEDQARDFVFRCENRNRAFAALAGQLRANRRVGHGTCEDSADGGAEVVGTFEKERSLFRKEQRELVVHVKLSDVCLDLGEVRIDREIGRHVRGNSPTHVQAALDVGTAGLQRYDSRIVRRTRL